MVSIISTARGEKNCKACHLVCIFITLQHPNTKRFLGKGCHINKARYTDYSWWLVYPLEHYLWPWEINVIYNAVKVKNIYEFDFTAAAEADEVKGKVLWLTRLLWPTPGIWIYNLYLDVCNFHLFIFKCHLNLA